MPVMQACVTAPHQGLYSECIVFYWLSMCLVVVVPLIVFILCLRCLFSVANTLRLVETRRARELHSFKCVIVVLFTASMFFGR